MLARVYSYMDQPARVRALLGALDLAEVDGATLRAHVVACALLDPVPTALRVLRDHRERFASDWPLAVDAVVRALGRRGEAEAAAGSLLSELGTGREWNDAVTAMANCLNHLGRLDQAEQLYLRLDDADELVVTERASMHFERGNYQACYDIAIQGLQRFPDSGLLLSLTGELGDLCGSPAPMVFARVVELMESVPVSRRSSYEGHLLAIAHVNLGNPVAAFALVDACAEPGAPWLLQSAMAAALVGDPARCAVQYDKAAAALAATDLLSRASAVRSHLADIEVYGRRGRLPDWLAFQRQARHRLEAMVPAIRATR